MRFFARRHNNITRADLWKIHLEIRLLLGKTNYWGLSASVAGMSRVCERM